MENKTTNEIEVSVNPTLLKNQSDFENDVYVFKYEIQLKNCGSRPVQVISRCWVISDSNGEVTHIEGKGVVGHQPKLQPGETYDYHSWAKIKSPMGTMQGHYVMRHLDDDSSFKAEIPIFSLNAPGRIN